MGVAVDTSISIVTPPRPGRHPVHAAIVRVVIGIGIFAVVFLGVSGLKTLRERALPLPDDVAAEGTCSIWFVGSSSIHKWQSLRHDMRPWIAHNRGINGASLEYLLHRFQNEPVRPKPSAIVFYGGENDIFAGESAADSIARFDRFLGLKTREYGDLPVFVVSLKPSPTRWGDLPEQTAFNRAARAIAARRADVTYVDIVPLMLVNRRPGPFYQEDGVHLSPFGYARWAGAIQTALKTTLPPREVAACLNHPS